MTDGTDFRRTWRQNWLNCLREFADEDLQRRMWLDPGSRNPHWSYIEFMCSYFDDTLHSRNYDWAIGEGLVTDQEVATVASLHYLLEHHEAPGGDDFDNERILKDQSWAEIVHAAKSSIGELASILKDPAERAILRTRG